MRKEKARFFTKKGAEKYAQTHKADILQDQYSDNPESRLGIGDVNKMVRVEPSKKFFRRWAVCTYPARRPTAGRMRTVA